MNVSYRTKENVLGEREASRLRTPWRAWTTVHVTRLYISPLCRRCCRWRFSPLRRDHVTYCYLTTYPCESLAVLFRITVCDFLRFFWFFYSTKSVWYACKRAGDIKVALHCDSCSPMINARRYKYNKETQYRV